MTGHSRNTQPDPPKISDRFAPKIPQKIPDWYKIQQGASNQLLETISSSISQNHQEVRTEIGSIRNSLGDFQVQTQADLAIVKDKQAALKKAQEDTSAEVISLKQRVDKMESRPSSVGSAPRPGSIPLHRSSEAAPAAPASSSSGGASRGPSNGTNDANSGASGGASTDSRRRISSLPDNGPASERDLVIFNRMYDSGENTVGLYPIVQWNVEQCTKALNSAGLQADKDAVLSLTVKEFLKFDMNMSAKDIEEVERSIKRMWREHTNAENCDPGLNIVYIEFTDYHARVIVYSYAGAMNALTRRQNNERREGEPRIVRNVFNYIIPQLTDTFRKMKFCERLWRNDEKLNGNERPESRVVTRGNGINTGTERFLYLQKRIPGQGKAFHPFTEKDLQGHFIPGIQYHKTTHSTRAPRELKYVKDSQLTPPGRKLPKPRTESQDRPRESSNSRTSSNRPASMDYIGHTSSSAGRTPRICNKPSTAGVTPGPSSSRTVSIVDNIVVTTNNNDAGTGTPDKRKRRSKSSSSSADSDADKSHIELLKQMLDVQEKYKRLVKRRKKDKSRNKSELAQEITARKLFNGARGTLSQSTTRDVVTDDSEEDSSSSSSSSSSDSEDDVFEKPTSKKEGKTQSQPVTSTPVNTPKKISKELCEKLRSTLTRSTEREEREKRIQKEKEKAQKGLKNRKTDKSASKKVSEEREDKKDEEVSVEALKGAVAVANRSRSGERSKNTSGAKDKSTDKSKDKDSSKPSRSSSKTKPKIATSNAANVTLDKDDINMET